MTLTLQWISMATASLWAWVGALNWIDVTEFFFVAMSIIGQHFISQRNPRGFGFWIVGNVAALFMFVALGRWMTAVLYIYFLYMCFKGLVTWRRLDASASETSKPVAVVDLSEKAVA